LRFTSAAGTSSASYDVQYSEATDARPGLCALSSVSISGGKFISAGATFVRGKKDTPVYLTGTNVYEMQIDEACDIAAVLHDTETRQAWLLDGASVLLHLTRAWLSSRHAREAPADVIEKFSHPATGGDCANAYEALMKRSNRKLGLFCDVNEQKKEETCYDDATGETSTKITTVKTKSWWRWEDLVQQKWRILEQIQDHMIRLRTSNPEISIPFRKQQIEGFEFSDLVSSKPQIRPRATHLASTSGDWLEFTTGVDAIHLLGSGFGDLLDPSINADIRRNGCSQHLPAPQDLDLLAAPLSILKNLSGRFSKKDGYSVRLGRDLYWHDAGSFFDCAYLEGRECATHVARFQGSRSICKKASKTIGELDVFKTYPKGAVLFGHCQQRLLKNRLPKRKRENDREDEGRRIRNAAKFSDSGIGMGSSSNANWSPPSQPDSNLSV
jgi:hypothetical protein